MTSCHTIRCSPTNFCLYLKINKNFKKCSPSFVSKVCQFMMQLPGRPMSSLAILSFSMVKQDLNWEEHWSVQLKKKDKFRKFQHKLDLNVNNVIKIYGQTCVPTDARFLVRSHSCRASSRTLWTRIPEYLISLTGQLSSRASNN